MKEIYIDFGPALTRVAWMVIYGVKLINTTYEHQQTPPAAGIITDTGFVEGYPMKPNNNGLAAVTIITIMLIAHIAGQFIPALIFLIFGVSAREYLRMQI